MKISRGAKLVLVAILISVVVLGFRFLADNVNMTVFTFLAANPHQTLIGKAMNDDVPSDTMTTNRFNVCTKGHDHLHDFDDKLKDEFMKFIEIYKGRPGENTFGTRMSHQFALFAMIRDLQPAKYTIENLIEVYYEFQTPWKTEFQSGIFEGRSMGDLQVLFAKEIDPTYWTDHYNNICYAKLTDNNADITKLDGLLEELQIKGVK